MEPGHEDREDILSATGAVLTSLPQWSPVTKTGKTCGKGESSAMMTMPQWSPVTKTGKTARTNGSA